MIIHPELRKVHEESKDVDAYYTDKYAYLKSHGFFGKPEQINFVTTLNELLVEESIRQVQQIVFEVTESCNLNCSYCTVTGEYYEGFDNESGKNIDVNSAVKLLKYIFALKDTSKNNQLTISFYGGEPLLNFKLIKQILEAASQINSEKELAISYMMTTNGTLIHKYLPFLLKNNFKLLISLDGNEENHGYRPFLQGNKNSFQKVIENVDLIQKKYPDYFDSNVSFNAVLHNRNSVAEIYKFIYNRYNKIPQISELASSNLKSDKKELFNEMFRGKRESEAEYQKENSELMQLTQEQSVSYVELTRFLKYFSVNFYISNITSTLVDEEKHFPTGTCIPFSKKIFLTNKNMLLPCEKISHKFSMGKVDKDVTINIPEVALQSTLYYERVQKICQHCYAHRFCGMCKYFMSNFEKIDSKDFTCEGFHNQKTFQTKLHRIFSYLEKHPNYLSEILENVIITS
jgi:uncharacterized protein